MRKKIIISSEKQFLDELSFIYDRLDCLLLSDCFNCRSALYAFLDSAKYQVSAAMRHSGDLVLI